MKGFCYSYVPVEKAVTVENRQSTEVISGTWVPLHYYAEREVKSIDTLDYA